MARIMGAVAKKESDDKARRLKRKHDEIAEAGRWKGGPRPFGYDVERDAAGMPMRNGTLVVREAEAEIIREAAKRVLAGESTWAICGDLNRRGVPTVGGGAWRTATLDRTLTCGIAAGKRRHHGDFTKAVWAPIIDETTWLRLRAKINDRRSSTSHRVGRVYLLTGGVARCGKCGSPLHAKRRQKGVRAYACLSGPNKGGCGGLTITAEPLEAYVVELLIYRLDSAEFAAANSKTDAIDVAAAAAADEVARLEGKLIEYADDFDEGRIGRSEWMHLRSKNEERLAELRKSQTRQTSALALTPFSTGKSLAEQWPSLSLDRRRAVVSALLDRVVVHPASRMGPGFDPGRVDPQWRL
jgi:hypothetical protein